MYLLRALKIWFMFSVRNIFLLICNKPRYKIFIISHNLRKSIFLKLGGRFCALLRARPGHEIPKNEMIDIFYNGLTVESRTYLDSCVGCIFRERTADEAEELMANIARNHDDWTIPEPPPTPTPKKRGILFLNPEDMREAKKSIKEKGIKAEHVEKLPPIENLCEPTTHPPMVEVHSLLDFDASDVPYNKPVSYTHL